MEWVKDVVGVDNVKPGTLRSLNGVADENIFQGRASKAGFYCFFKVWRDMPYDAILDYNGNLYRVEVKGSSKNKFDVTRGGRSGEQIKRGLSRTRLISREDCDFVVCVDSNTGECYIVPEDVIQIMGLKKLSASILMDFKEKWGLFIYSKDANVLDENQTRKGLMGADDVELDALLSKLNTSAPLNDIRLGRSRAVITDPKHKKIYRIWKTIAENLA